MIIKGKSRGNGLQLAEYLTKTQDNDRVQVLDIRGTAKPQDLKKSLLEMSLSVLQTKGEKGLYHAQINPRDFEGMAMTSEAWLQAADILEKHLKLNGQKRAIVLHEKNGRPHAHVVWERYNQDNSRLIDDGHNYKAHDKARAEIERQLKHEPTREKRDKSREPSHKERLTKLWKEAENARDFIDRAKAEGYQIARGLDRRPFRVITPEGTSLDLVRQLYGQKTIDVAHRLYGEQLPTEAKALNIPDLVEKTLVNTKNIQRPSLDQKQETLINMIGQVKKQEIEPLDKKQEIFLGMTEEKRKKETEQLQEKKQALDISKNDLEDTKNQKILTEKQQLFEAMREKIRQQEGERLRKLEADKVKQKDMTKEEKKRYEFEQARKELQITQPNQGREQKRNI